MTEIDQVTTDKELRTPSPKMLLSSEFKVLKFEDLDDSSKFVQKERLKSFSNRIIYYTIKQMKVICTQDRISGPQKDEPK